MGVNAVHAGGSRRGHGALSACARLWCFCVPLLVSPPAAADGLLCPHAPPLGSFESGFSAQHVVQVGHLAIVARGSAGVQILDLSDPAAPLPLSMVPMAGSAARVAVDGNLLYVAAGSGGMRIVDISNPSAPIPMGMVPIAHANDVAVSGAIVCVAAGTEGLRVVDVSDPSVPTVIGLLPLLEFSAFVAMEGTRAYVSTVNLLRVIDLTLPHAPQPLGLFVHGAGGLLQFEVRDALVYLPQTLGSSPRVRILDCTNPMGIFLRGECEIHGDAYPRRVRLQGHLLCVAVQEGGLHTVDVSDPSAPSRAGAWSQDGMVVMDVSVLGDLVVVAADGGGIHTLDIAAIPAHPILGYAPTAGSTVAPALSDGRLVTRSGPSLTTIHILDVHDPTQPMLAGSYDTGAIIFALAAAQNVAYVATHTGLRRLDITDPAAPVDLGGIPGLGGAVVSALAFTGTHLLAAAEYTLFVIDTKAPGSPVIVGSIAVSEASDIVVDGTLVYTIGVNGVVIIDLSAPSAPTLVGTRRVNGTQLALAGHRLYVRWGWCGGDQCGATVEVLDVSVPQQPVSIGSFDAIAAVRIEAIEEDRLVLTSSGAWTPLRGLFILDCTDLLNVSVERHLPDVGAARSFRLRDGLAYVGSAQGHYIVNTGGCAQSPPAPGDLDGDGTVGMTDMLILLSTWGPCGDCGSCPEDLDGDCEVSFGDLLVVLSNWS